MFNFK
jgi:hypothetical protein